MLKDLIRSASQRWGFYDVKEFNEKFAEIWEEVTSINDEFIDKEQFKEVVKSLYDYCERIWDENKFEQIYHDLVASKGKDKLNF